MPAHAHAAIAVAVHDRNNADDKARGRAECDGLDIEMLFGLAPELEAMKETLDQILGILRSVNRFSREVFQILVSFLVVANPESIGRLDWTALLGAHIRLEVVTTPFPRTEIFLPGFIDLIDGDAFGDDDETIETDDFRRNADV